MPVPAVLRPLELRRVVAIGRRAFEVLGLRDYGRVDVRLDERGTPYVIDVNPNCDVSEGGGFSLAAARAGISYAGFVWEILRGVLRRRGEEFDALRRPRAGARGQRGVPCKWSGGVGVSARRMPDGRMAESPRAIAFPSGESASVPDPLFVPCPAAP